MLQVEPEESEDDQGGAFTANPADDIPRNKLTEKLARGIQTFVQRMQKREGFRAEIRVQPQGKSWVPPPRESASLTSCSGSAYMIGGMNCEPVKEVVQAKVVADQVEWSKVHFYSQEQIQGRQCHSTIQYQNKLFVFGGCFQFNRKRMVRECTNQVLEYDLTAGTIEVLKCKGVSIGSRKNHSAVAYKGSMIVYGGQTENGMVS